MEQCKLRLSEEKTKIVYCQDYRRRKIKGYPKKFDFLGFTFKPRPKKSKREGGVFLGFDCEISQKSQKRIIQKWKVIKFHRQSDIPIQDIANRLRSQTLGVVRYYGYFSVSTLGKLFNYLQRRLAKWVRKKYKSMKGSFAKAYRWLKEIKISYPTLFYHWQLFKTV